MEIIEVNVKPEDPNSRNELEFEAMNTSFFISIKDSVVENWKEPILKWFEYVESDWSRFRENNELARLNQSKIGDVTLLSPPFFDLLQIAEEYRKKTDGLFSPYLMSQLEGHGYSRSFPFKHSESVKVNKTVEMVDPICPFHFNPEELSVTRISEGKVDVGGIGKGYAVESAANWLKNITQASYGIVDGGGDISVWSNGEKEWKIGIAHPFVQNIEVKQICLKNGSIATSNIVYRSWIQGNQKKHHILNGITGEPVESEILQSTIVTTSCLDAEVSAKLCFMETGKALKELLMSINPIHKAILFTREEKIKEI